MLVHQDYYYFSHPNLVYVHVPYQRHGNNVYGTPWGLLYYARSFRELGSVGAFETRSFFRGLLPRLICLLVPLLDRMYP